MSRLYISVLGPPEVSLDEIKLTFPTRKTLALLIYLAIQSGRHTREEITALFWPESEPRRARAAMRRTLSYLRAAIGPPDPLLGGDLLGLAPHLQIELDIQLLQTGDSPARRIDPAVLESALQAYRSEFLAGFSLPDAPAFEDWVTVEREYWHRRASFAFDRLVQFQSESGAEQAAIETAARWATHDPLAEAPHRRLMEMYFAAGDRSAALSVFGTLRKRLVAELEAEPSPATIALAERIRSQAPPPPAPRDDPPASFPEEVPLTGRAAEFAQLVANYREAVGSRAQFVLLEGEAGIGKTRLAREFLSWARAQGADILLGNAYEGGQRVAYLAITQALRARVEAENAPEDLLPDVWLVELSRLLPELRDRYPDLPQPGGEEQAAQVRLFEAVARLGLALTARAPVVLLLDDLQWMDPASLDMLQYVLAFWSEQGAPVMVLTAARSDELALAPALTGWLADIERRIPTARIPLASLTPAELNDLLAAISHREPHTALPERLGKWLFRETEGQPLYIVETLKELTERGALTWRDVDGRWRLLSAAPDDSVLLYGRRPLPPGVREVIRSRLDRLEGAARSFCIAAAVLGAEFAFEQAQQVADLTEAEALSALDELISRGLLRAVGTAGVRLSFTHDRIRDVAYELTGDVRRRFFHGRALEVCQVDDAPAVELAHHAYAGGLSEAAFRFSLQAGDEASQIFAVNVSIAHYEQARQLLPTIEAKPDQIRYLYQQLGRAYELQNDFDRAREVYRSMLALSRKLEDVGLEIAALDHLATLTSQRMHDFETAVGLLKEAQAIAVQRDDKPSLAETEWNLAQVNFYRFDWKSALEHGQHALALAKELDLAELTARSQNVIAYAETIPGNWGTAETYAMQACTGFAVLGNRALEADSLSLAGKARINLGRTEDGIEATKEALAISREIENIWGQANCTNHLAFGYLERGEYGRALSLVQEGVTLAQNIHFPLLLVFNLVMLGNIYRAMLALEEAQTAHREAAVLNEMLPVQPFTRTLAIELCADCALAEKWDKAHDYAREALTAQDITMIHSGLTHWFEIEALVNGGDLELAVEKSRHFGERFGVFPRYRIPYLRSLAALDYWKSDLDRAIARSEAALESAEMMNLPGEQWPILAKLGELHQAIGDEEKARQAFGEATEIVQAIAANIDDEGLRVGFLAYALHTLGDDGQHL